MDPEQSHLFQSILVQPRKLELLKIKKIYWLLQTVTTTFVVINDNHFRNALPQKLFAKTVVGKGIFKRYVDRQHKTDFLN